MKLIDKFKAGVKKLLKGKEDEPWMAEVRQEARNEAIAEVKVELKDKFKQEEKKKILEGKKGGMEKAMNTLSKGFAAGTGGLNAKDKLGNMLGSGNTGSNKAVSKMLGDGESDREQYLRLKKRRDMGLPDSDRIKDLMR